MFHLRLGALFSVLCLTAVCLSAAPQTPHGFEIADIRPSPRSSTREISGGLMAGGSYSLRGATMLDLVSLAYATDARKVLGGPGWLAIDRFDIRAKLPPGAGAAALPPMLRVLLEERFALAAHRDTQPVEAWALTAGPHHHLKSADPAGAPACQSPASADPIRIACRNTTMAGFVSNLPQLEGAWYYLGDNLVVDRTGLAGAWDFEIGYSRRWNATVPGPGILSLFDSLQNLGLSLDPAQVPMPVVLVDRVNRTPSPNPPNVANAFPPPPAAFEVATIKPTDPAHPGEDFQWHDGGRIAFRGVKLLSLIADAWDVTPDTIIGAPKFLDSDRWDFLAQAPGLESRDGDGDTETLALLFRRLLAERFRFAAHYEERTLPANTLTASHPKLRRADPTERSGCKEGPPTLSKADPRAANPVLGRLLTCTNVSMAWFAEQLPRYASGYIHSEVLDATGLQGGWDFTLSFSKAAQFSGGSPETSGPEPRGREPNGALSAPEALLRQLGLKLELRKRPVRVLVIDRIERRPTEN